MAGRDDAGSQIAIEALARRTGSCVRTPRFSSHRRRARRR